MKKIFGNLKLNTKMSLLAVFYILLLLFIGVTAAQSIVKTNENMKELSDTQVVPISSLETAKSNVEYVNSKILLIMQEKDSEKKLQIQDDLLQHADMVMTQIKKYESLKGLRTSNKEIADLKNLHGKYEDALGNLLRVAGISTANMGSSGGSGTVDSSTDDMQALMDEYHNQTSSLTGDFDRLIQSHIKGAENTYNKSQQDFQLTMGRSLGVMVVAIIFCILLSSIIARSIIKPVRKVIAKLDDISNKGGDLTQRIGYHSKDEIGQLSNSFDRFIDKLQGIIKEVSEYANNIAASTKQLSIAATDSNRSLEEVAEVVGSISEATSEHAAAVEEITASIEEAAQLSETSAVASKETSENSKIVNESAESGAERIEDIVTAIHGISFSGKELNDIIQSLSESSGKIVEIIKVITSISSQTNMLALNAAIEAARAGEAGRGFNVVAIEIRNLADESSAAAKKIETLVKDNEMKVINAVKCVTAVDKTVENCMEKTKEVESSIQNIIFNIKNVTNRVQEIDKAVEQQAFSMEEVNKEVGNISNSVTEVAAGNERMTKRITDQVASMEEIEAASYEIAQLADALHSITNNFRV